MAAIAGSSVAFQKLSSSPLARARSGSVGDRLKVLQVGRSLPAVRQDGSRRMAVRASGSGVQNIKGGLVVSNHGGFVTAIVTGNRSYADLMNMSKARSSTIGSCHLCFPRLGWNFRRAITPDHGMLTQCCYRCYTFFLEQKKVTSSELDNLLGGERSMPIVIDFYATWCGPCILLAQELEKAS